MFASHAVVLAALAAAASPSPTPSPPASATAPAACAVTFVVASGLGKITISPTAPTVSAGACATFANNSDGTVKVSVTGPGAAWSATLGHDQTGNYSAVAVGVHPVKVTGLLVSTSATIKVIKAAPSSSGSPSGSHSSGASSASASSPQASTSPSRSKSNTKGKTSRPPIPVLSIPPGLTASPYTLESQGPGVSPLVAGSLPATSPPTPTLTPSDPVTSVPAQSVALTGATGDSDRLPIAIAALVALGEALAILRVLIGVPVDSSRRRRGRRP